MTTPPPDPSATNEREALREQTAEWMFRFLADRGVWRLTRAWSALDPKARQAFLDMTAHLEKPTGWHACWCPETAPPAKSSCACGEEAETECAACDRPLCWEHARRGPSGDRFCDPGCPGPGRMSE
jgi:hypothetical protein